MSTDVFVFVPEVDRRDVRLRTSAATVVPIWRGIEPVQGSRSVGGFAAAARAQAGSGVGGAHGRAGAAPARGSAGAGGAQGQGRAAPLPATAGDVETSGGDKD